MPRLLNGGLRSKVRRVHCKVRRVHCSCFDLSKGQLIGDLETSYSLSLAFGCTLQIVVSLSNSDSAKKRHQHESTIWILWVPNAEIYRSYTHLTHVGLWWDIRVSQQVHGQQQENPSENPVLLGSSSRVSWLIDFYIVYIFLCLFACFLFGSILRPTMKRFLEGV